MTSPSPTLLTSFSYNPQSLDAEESFHSILTELNRNYRVHVWLEPEHLSQLQEILPVRTLSTFFLPLNLCTLVTSLRTHDAIAMGIVYSAQRMRTMTMLLTLLLTWAQPYFLRPTSDSDSAESTLPSYLVLMKEIGGSLKGYDRVGRIKMRTSGGADPQTANGILLEMWDNIGEVDEVEDEEDDENEDGEDDEEREISRGIANPNLHPGVGVEVGRSEGGSSSLIDVDIALTNSGVNIMVSVEISTKNNNLSPPTINLRIYLSKRFCDKYQQLPSFSLAASPASLSARPSSDSATLSEKKKFYQSHLNQVVREELMKGSGKSKKELSSQFYNELLPPQEVRENEDWTFTEVLHLAWILSDRPVAGFQIPFSSFFKEDLPPETDSWRAKVDRDTLSRIGCAALQVWEADELQTAGKKILEENMAKGLKRGVFDDSEPVLASKKKKKGGKGGKKADVM